MRKRINASDKSATEKYTSSAKSEESKDKKKNLVKNSEKNSSPKRDWPAKRFEKNDREGEKRPYKRRDEGEGERKSFKKRDEGYGEKKSYRRSDDGQGEKRPYKRRDEGEGERKSFKKRDEGYGEKKSYRRSDEGQGEKRPYKRRDEGFGEKKTYRRSDEGQGERRPYKKRDEGFGEKKSYRRSDERQGEKRPYKRRDEGQGEKRPYKRRDEGQGERGQSYKRPRDYDRGGSQKIIERKSSKSTKPKSEGIRLNKYIANAGICSRREADELITCGAIKVNGEIVTELGTRVKPTDHIEYGNQKLANEKPVYLLLNKPKDYITTVEDPDNRKTVMHLISGACKERVFPVGRLDRNTTGLLLFTNDGELTKKLLHPKYHVKKLYHIELDKSIPASEMATLLKGVELEDGFVKADAIEWVGTSGDKKHVGMEIHIGKNRVVRRMFESLGYKVIKLDRVMFAGLTKKNLPRGKWRFLTEMEINRLRMNNFV